MPVRLSFPRFPDPDTVHLRLDVSEELLKLVVVPHRIGSAFRPELLAGGSTAAGDLAECSVKHAYGELKLIQRVI